MKRVIRCALTETRNVYEPMPESIEDLGDLAGHLDELRAANIAHHQELIRQAAEAGADVVGLGELFGAPYFALTKTPLWHALAEDAEHGPTITALRESAASLGLVIVAPIYEKDPSSGRRYNTAVILNDDGELLGRYRKNHIPSGRNERASFHEDHYYERGDGPENGHDSNISSNPYFPVFATRVGRIGVSICYDRHFEGSVSTLAREGAELILSPAVTFGAHSRRLWRLEFAVDAARHGVFIGASNRRGSEAPFGVEYFGESHFVGPEGELPNRSSHPDLVIADLDLETRKGAGGSGWDLERDRRPDIYGSEP